LFEPTSNRHSVKIVTAITNLFATAKPSSSSSSSSSPPLLSHIAPNLHELSSIFDYAQRQGFFEDRPSCQFRQTLERDDGRFLETVKARLPAWVTDEKVLDKATMLLSFVGTVWVKCGARGTVVVTRLDEGNSEWATAFSSNTVTEHAPIVNTTPQGTSFAIKHFPAITIHETDSIESVVGAGDSFAGALLAGLVNGLDHAASPASLDRLVDVGQRRVFSFPLVDTKQCT
jgi:pseudouridine-5'-phosphate glycosidase/pseudouridine kinase